MVLSAGFASIPHHALHGAKISTVVQKFMATSFPDTVTPCAERVPGTFRATGFLCDQRKMLSDRLVLLYSDCATRSERFQTSRNAYHKFHLHLEKEKKKKAQKKGVLRVKQR